MNHMRISQVFPALLDLYKRVDRRNKSHPKSGPGRKHKQGAK